MSDHHIPASNAATANLQPPASTIMAATHRSVFGVGRFPTGILHLTGKVFLFFSLPRELRDLIYDMTLDRKKGIRKADPHDIHGCRLPYEHLLLINRQFRRELLERVPLKSTLIVDISSDRPLQTPLRLQYVAHLELRIDCPWSNPLNWRPSVPNHDVVTAFERWMEHIEVNVLEDLKSLKTFRSVTISLYVLSQEPPNLDKRVELGLRLCHHTVLSTPAWERASGLNVYAYKRSGVTGDPSWKLWDESAVLCMKESSALGSLELVNTVETQRDIGLRQLLEMLGTN